MIVALLKYSWVLTVRGFMAIAFGLAVLLWTDPTLNVMVWLFGLFSLIEGFLTIITFLTNWR